jgi:hypothetical protein
LWKGNWKFLLPYGFKEDVAIWWQSLDFAKMMALFDDAYEKLLLDKWSHAKSKDKESTKGLFS